MKKDLPKKINGYYKFEDYEMFKPNLSPVDVLKMGSFGGTYFRPIYSNVTNKNYKNRYAKCLPKQFLDSMTKEEIKNAWKKNGLEASSSGTNMHENIEKY